MEKINIAELLRDCPKGMELNSTMYEDLHFEYVDALNMIHCYIENETYRTVITFNKFGTPNSFTKSKCVIFPKGKTTWKDFHRPFKDGDIIHVCNEYSDATFNDVAILKQIEKGGKIHCYCFYNYEEDYFSTNDFLYDDYARFATEEEKEKLFKVIKDNGYEWNPESKTLKKLTESKEDTDDRVVMSGIYFDRENYADEVELHLNNYEIEIRDGKTYAIFKNQETKISKPRFKVGDKIKNKSLDIFKTLEITAVSPRIYTFTNGSFQYVESIDKDYELVNEPNIEPKFKVGDKIKHKNTVLIIISVQTNHYIVEDEPNNFGILMFSQQDEWELINEPRFKVGDRVKSIFNNYQYDIKELTDTHYTLVEVESEFKYTEPIADDKNWELVPSKFNINNLKPFDKVLVRDGNDEEWVNAFFGFCDPETYKTCIFVTGNENWCQCIPYEGNEHLLGTTNDCDEYFKNW